MQNHITCAHCGSTVPESEFCPSCGKAQRKWCSSCGDWKNATHTDLEVDDAAGTGVPIVLAESQVESIFCPDCGTKLQTKSAAHE